jgi:uroporphyrin-3 C-methyltransferase
MVKNEELEEHKIQDSPISKPTPMINKSWMTGLGVLLIALGALTISLYTLSLNHEVRNKLTDNNQHIATQLEKLTQGQSQIQNQMDTQIVEKTTLEKNRASLEAQFDALNKELHRVMSQRFYQNQNWQLLKARYYLELAQINTHWSDRFDATIAMLQQADQLLSQLSEPKIFDIRQAIAKDIAQLQALPKIDIVGILSQLDAAQEHLNELNSPSIFNEKQLEKTNDSQSSKNALPTWRLRLQDSINLLGKLVVIRRQDEPIKPLLSPVFEALLKENIRLNLQEAQWAVLNGNPQIYHLVLNQALSILRKNFNQGVPNTEAFMKNLIELQQIEFTQKKPEIGSALPLLNQLIDVKTEDSYQANTPKPGGNSP